MAMWDCALMASALSCQAQVGMAKVEAAQNDITLAYISNPLLCDRFHSQMDRSLEYTLQNDKTLAMSRKLCVTKTPLYQTGDWEIQMTPVFPSSIPAEFNKSTRSK